MGPETKGTLFIGGIPVGEVVGGLKWDKVTDQSTKDGVYRGSISATYILKMKISWWTKVKLKWIIKRMYRQEMREHRRYYGKV